MEITALTSKMTKPILLRNATSNQAVLEKSNDYLARKVSQLEQEVTVLFVLFASTAVVAVLF